MAYMLLRPFGKKNSRSRDRSTGRFEIGLLISVLAAGIPGTILSLLLLWSGSYALDHKIEATFLVLLLWTGLSFSARGNVIQALRSLSNVVLSLKEDNFSFRAIRGLPGDAFGELAIEINELATAIETERRGALEAASLLQKVITEVDAVIFAVSASGEVKLLNRSAAAFLGNTELKVLHRTADELGIQDLVNGPPSETISRFHFGVEKRWFIARSQFRQQGLPLTLVMLSEVSEALRATERLAWQRLVRVLSHEINNSLAPIKSISRTLSRLSDQKLAEPERENFKYGLEVIGSRAESLNRFLQSYAQLTRLPIISKQTVVLTDLLTRVVAFEHRIEIETAGPEVVLIADQDQLEQVLINLCKNSVEAVLSRQVVPLPPSSVVICWSVRGKDLLLQVRDKGVGVLDVSNLFVPFYTTKEHGTGIGLALSRQIIESHGGTLMIRNREDGCGCEAEIKIPGCVLPEPESRAILTQRALDRGDETNP
ncbi:MAG TPA: ATP-binding protein [Candidatus Angelobacter sp.]|nr:ATP-binding protein [Candidatus Angelobacter sp.]